MTSEQYANTAVMMSSVALTQEMVITGPLVYEIGVCVEGLRSAVLLTASASAYRMAMMSQLLLALPILITALVEYISKHPRGLTGSYDRMIRDNKNSIPDQMPDIAAILSCFEVLSLMVMNASTYAKRADYSPNVYSNVAASIGLLVKTDLLHRLARRLVFLGKGDMLVRSRGLTLCEYMAVELVELIEASTYTLAPPLLQSLIDAIVSSNILDITSICVMTISSSAVERLFNTYKPLHMRPIFRADDGRRKMMIRRLLLDDAPCTRHLLLTLVLFDLHSVDGRGMLGLGKTSWAASGLPRQLRPSSKKATGPSLDILSILPALLTTTSEPVEPPKGMTLKALSSVMRRTRAVASRVLKGETSTDDGEVDAVEWGRLRDTCADLAHRCRVPACV